MARKSKDGALQIMDYDGRRITRPGIYRGVPLADYHGDICEGPSISSSGLRTIFMESPAHYFVSSPYNDERDPDADKPSEAMILGRAAHHLFLEQKHFSTTFAVRPETIGGEAWQGNRKVCREWLADQAKAGLVVLTPEQYRRIIAMSKALAKEPLIQNGILAGKVEHSIFAKHPKTGVWLKARPDVIPTDAWDFVDLKTSAKIDDEDLQGVIGDFAYHMQGATIDMALELAIGARMNTFNLVFIESKEPHCVRIAEVKHDALAAGRDQCEAALALFAKCMRTGEWIGPAGHQTEVAPIGLKPWRTERNLYRLNQIKREISS